MKCRQWCGCTRHMDLSTAAAAAAAVWFLQWLHRTTPHIHMQGSVGWAYTLARRYAQLTRSWPLCQGLCSLATCLHCCCASLTCSWATLDLLAHGIVAVIIRSACICTLGMLGVTIHINRLLGTYFRKLHRPFGCAVHVPGSLPLSTLAYGRLPAIDPLHVACVLC